MDEDGWPLSDLLPWLVSRRSSPTSRRRLLFEWAIIYVTSRRVFPISNWEGVGGGGGVICVTSWPSGWRGEFGVRKVVLRAVA